MDADALRRWLYAPAASHEFSGVALVWRDGTPLLQYAGGIAHRGHGVPTTRETRFGVASVTKMVTAATALRLVDRGELRLDQPLIEILPPEHHTRAITAEHRRERRCDDPRPPLPGQRSSCSATRTAARGRR